MKNHKSILWLLPLVAVSCADDNMFPDTPIENTSNPKAEIIANIIQTNTTRANDTGFADGDRIGIFAVAYTSESNPGTLKPQGNFVNNAGFTFQESENTWKGDYDIYFPDDKTPLDFYGFYPKPDNLDNVENFQFSVARNQATEATSTALSGYEASDFLWSKCEAVTAATPRVTLNFAHIMAGIKVTLVEGSGFAESEWATLDKNVLVTNTNLNASINLATGIATASSEADITPIIPAKHNNEYRAIAVPQKIAAEESLLSITVDGKSYAFTRKTDTEYLPSKLHNFTIQVNKSAGSGDYELALISESVTAWESDPDSHDGKIKEYVVVNVAEAGGLEEAVKSAGLDAKSVKNLKITGELTDVDFEYIKGQMQQLEALNLKEVILRNCHASDNVYYECEPEDFVLPDKALNQMKNLTYFVFPDKLLKIGQAAFRETNLSGSLDLPEGLENIYSDAFNNWNDYTDCNTNLSGTLTLPSTLKYIGGNVFVNCDFTGPLVLPNSLEYIGGGAFSGCEYLEGQLTLPHGLTYIGRQAFSGTKRLTGKLVIPERITTIEGFEDMGVTSVVLPEGITEIRDNAFQNTPIRGDIIIPSSVKKIGEGAFGGTQISHITLPPTISILEPRTLAFCKFLCDTVTVPQGVEVIGNYAFIGCENLDAVVIPKSVVAINEEVFSGCRSLSYIKCLALDPPTVAQNTFNGIAKDNFTIEVPEESVDKYRNAEGWKEFKRISAYKNFVARPSKFNVLNNGGVHEIILNADDAWELTDIPDWCHVDVTSGNKKTVLQLTVDKMEHGSPNRTGAVTFKLKGDEEHLTHINVSQFDYEHDEDSYLQLNKATKGKGINLFFCGDGYDAADIASGSYLNDMKQNMEYFFSVEPYTTYRDYFNVYTGFARSDDSGIESVDFWRTTKFHVALGKRDGRLYADSQAAFDYCASVMKDVYDQNDPYYGIVLLANTNVYEGVTYTAPRDFCAIVTKSDSDYPYNWRGVLMHEAGGHGFGKLADEYIYHNDFIQKCICFCCEHVDALLAGQAWGFGLNVSLESKYSKVPWAHLMNDEHYSDIVDVFEGGYFHSRGVFRSEYNSCMNNNIPYFSTWSRELIVRKIMERAGFEFNYDNFVANDNRDMITNFTRSSASSASTSPIRGNAPILISNYKSGKKGGRK